jgi:SMC interacting uncharacterized protein involved in chromosome segregation
MPDSSDMMRRQIDREFSAHLAADAARLDRIEQKIDKLAETVISLARAEEKLIALEEDRSVIHKQLERQTETISKLEKRVSENEVTIRVINRIFWIMTTAIVTGAVGTYIFTR